MDREAPTGQHLAHISSKPDSTTFSGFLRRERLTNLINYPFLAPVTVVTAAAGYGKTTLLQDWSSLSTRPVAWIELHAGDNDPKIFTSRLHLALRTMISPGDNASEDAHPEPDNLIQQFANSPREACIILDDCHVLSNPQCLSLLDSIIHDASPRLFFLITSRNHLPLRLGRMRSQLNLREIVREDLAFTEAETAKFIRDQSSVSMSREEIHQTQEETEGWITGIRLIIQARLHHSGMDTRDPGDASVRNTFLDEYVAQEILAPLPDSLQTFLLATSILPYVSNDSADVLETVDVSSNIIDILEKQFGFVVKPHLSDGRVRYHQLINQSLQRLYRANQLYADRLQWDRQIANWLIARGDLESAADVALRSGNELVIAEFVKPICAYLAIRSQFEDLNCWLQRVPESVLNRDLDLAYWKVLGKLGLGYTIGLEHTLNELVPRLKSSGEPLHAGRAYVCQGMLAFHTKDHARTESCLMDALDCLPNDSYTERLHATTYLGLLSNRLGADDDASVIYAKATTYAAELPLEEQWSWRTLGPDRGNVYALRGALHSATTKYRMLLAELPAALRMLEGFYRCRLVSFAIEQNDLRTARQELDRIARIKGHAHQEWHHDAVIAEVRYHMAKGRFEEADRIGSDYVKNLRRSPKKQPLVTHLATIWLLRGEHLMVESWLDDIGEQSDPWIDVFGDMNPVLLRIDLDLARGRLERAAELAHTYANAAAGYRRWSEFIEFTVRHAAALALLGLVDESRAIMSPAIERGLQGGFSKAFVAPILDTRLLHSDLWQEAENRRRKPDQPGGILSPSPVLSSRELEVLQLVAEDKSNHQIAEELFISANTVRNHLVNITRRLDVSSRHAAVQRARQAGLLTADSPQR